MSQLNDIRNKLITFLYNELRKEEITQRQYEELVELIKTTVDLNEIFAVKGK